MRKKNLFYLRHEKAQILETISTICLTDTSALLFLCAGSHEFYILTYWREKNISIEPKKQSLSLTHLQDTLLFFL